MYQLQLPSNHCIFQLYYLTQTEIVSSLIFRKLIIQKYRSFFVRKNYVLNINTNFQCFPNTTDTEVEEFYQKMLKYERL